MGHALTRLLLGLLVVLGSVAPSPALAKDPAKTLGETEIAQARAAAKKGDGANAGAVLGGLVVTAVRMKNLGLEQRAAEALEEILDEVEKDATGNARGDALGETWPGRAKGREVAAAAMKPLDPKRHGLYVSAHALATSIVLDAAALGDAEHLSDAAAVLAAFAGTPKAGSAAVTFSRLAEGIRLARANEGEKALAPLGDAARKGDAWMLPALYAYLELAVLQLKAGDASKSALSIASACALPPKDADLSVMGDWMHAVETRWKDAPKEALDTFRTSAERFLGASAGAKGGRGGAGGAGGAAGSAAEDLSPLGRALPRWPASKAFVTAKRGKGGFEIRLPFDEKANTSEPVALARGANPWDASGVTILLAGPAVALRMADLTGTAGQPGERSRASRAWAYYWLADGETWGATKDGAIVTGP